MALKTPEQDLEEFLVAQPPWMRKLSEPGTLSPEEWSYFWFWRLASSQKAQDVFERLLQRCPAKWREYRKRCKQVALRSVPKGRRGRPRKDLLANEAVELREKGLSYGAIADELNRRHGAGTTDPDSIGNLIRSRTTKTKPEENRS
jgi:hypothetical protein